MSRKVETPLYEASHDGGRLRLFRSPLHLRYNRADMPWHSTDDLRRLAGFSEDGDRTFQTLLRQDWKEPETIATQDGITTIAPHFMAEGLIGSMLGHPELFARDRIIALRSFYRRSQTQALRLLTRHLHPVEKLIFSLAAMETGNGQ